MHLMTSLKHGKSMSKATTDLQTMTSRDRRILCQGITQAVINARYAPKYWEQLTIRGVKVALRTLKSIDPNERKSK